MVPADLLVIATLLLEELDLDPVTEYEPELEGPTLGDVEMETLERLFEAEVWDTELPPRVFELVICALEPDAPVKGVPLLKLLLALAPLLVCAVVVTVPLRLLVPVEEPILLPPLPEKTRLPEVDVVIFDNPVEASDVAAKLLDLRKLIVPPEDWLIAETLEEFSRI